MKRTVITHGLVITMDPERRMIQDGAVVMEGNKIAAVGKSAELMAKNKDARQLDATGKLVLPGFIDGHNHPVQYLSKGIGDDIHIHRWLYERVYPYEAALTSEDVYFGALGNFVEMIKTGTTCLVDPGGYHVESIARAVKEVGLRAILNRSTRDIEDPSFPLPKELSDTTDQAIRNGEELVQKWHKTEGDRIRVWYSLRVIYNVSDRLCQEIKKRADKYGVGIHAHLCAMKEENQEVMKRWGVRSLERFRRLGLIAPNLYLVHMGDVNDQEVELLKENDVKVCHCPSASMHGAYGAIGYGMFPKMISRGVTVSLGSDSATAGRFLDMVRVMYLAACAHKDAHADPTIMGAHKALEMATVDGARALFWEGLGSLEEGNRADIIIVDTSGPEWHPMIDPVANLIYSASGRSVETVIVDGKVIMEKGNILTVDEGEIGSQVRERGKSVLKRAGLNLAPKWPTI